MGERVRKRKARALMHEAPPHRIKHPAHVIHPPIALLSPSLTIRGQLSPLPGVKMVIFLLFPFVLVFLAVEHVVRVYLNVIFLPIASQSSSHIWQI